MSDPLSTSEDMLLRDEAVPPFSSTHHQDLLLTVSFDNSELEALEQRSSFGEASCSSSSGIGLLQPQPSNPSNNLFIFSDTHSDLLAASTPETRNFIIKGSPGHTPFPHDKVIPSAPFNTPDIENLEEVLIHETAKQEAALKDRLNEITLVEVFGKSTNFQDTPKRGARDVYVGGDGPNNFPRRSLSACMDNVEYLNVKKGEGLIISNRHKSREKVSRDRIKNSIDILKKVIPGISHSSDQNEIFEQTAKYLLFIRKKVGAKFDRDFLSNFLP